MPVNKINMIQEISQELYNEKISVMRFDVVVPPKHFFFLFLTALWNAVLISVLKSLFISEFAISSSDRAEFCPLFLWPQHFRNAFWKMLLFYSCQNMKCLTLSHADAGNQQLMQQYRFGLPKFGSSAWLWQMTTTNELWKTWSIAWLSRWCNKNEGFYFTCVTIVRGSVCTYLFFHWKNLCTKIGCFSTL